MRFKYYYEPETIAECSELLSKYGAEAKILAGGTDIVPQLKNSVVKAEVVLNIQRIPGISEIHVEETGVTIGAMARLRNISKDVKLQDKYQVIMETAGHVSSLQVRNMATIGGNACNASPSADAIQGLMLLDALVLIESAGKKRQVPISAFFKGPGKTVLEKDEMVHCFKVPAPAPGTGASYKKFAIRGDIDISIVGAGAAITLGKDGNISKARISLAAVAPTPVRMKMVEALLEGKKPTAELIAEAAEMASANVTPITDQRATASYRTEMVKVWTKNAIEEAIARAETAN